MQNDVIAPKDKAFLDIKLVQECMDNQSKMVAIAFGKWLKHLDNGTTHYNPYTQETTDSIGFSPSDCFFDNLMTVEELYNKFIESITK